ncbi:MAG: DUF4421 domain-containing protein [Endomicrobium sp.]|jgi:hypothetical protein|nr:DUF4421 domain-containing protein [Endomicrobium sp.]
MRLKTIFFSFTLILFGGGFAYAQEKAETMARSAFVREYNNSFLLQVLIVRNFMTLEGEDGGGTASFEPDTPNKLGFGFAYKSIAFAYSFDVFKEGHGVGTRSDDFQFYIFPKHFAIDAFWQRYKGFRAKSGDGKFEKIFDDMIFQRASLCIEYVFNDKLSLAAAFSQTEKQLKSAGSFLLGGGFYYNELNFEGIEENVQIGPLVGYAYTFVFLKDFYFTGVIAGGINLTSKADDDENLINYVILPKFALGYSRDLWSFSIFYIFHNDVVSSSKDYEFAAQSGQFAFSLAVRFKI